jgi:hypothetical protein
VLGRVYVDSVPEADIITRHHTPITWTLDRRKRELAAAKSAEPRGLSSLYQHRLEAGSRAPWRQVCEREAYPNRRRIKKC